MVQQEEEGEDEAMVEAVQIDRLREAGDEYWALIQVLPFDQSSGFCTVGQCVWTIELPTQGKRLEITPIAVPDFL